jgi:hypothetical protein
MIENEGVRVEEARCCLLCGGEGVPLYGDLRDRIFSAPGIWSLIQCPKCQLVWLNPRPLPILHPPRARCPRENGGRPL